MPRSHLSVLRTLTDPFVGKCSVPDAISTDSAAETSRRRSLEFPQFSLERAPFPKVRNRDIGSAGVRPGERREPTGQMPGENLSSSEAPVARAPLRHQFDSARKPARALPRRRSRVRDSVSVPPRRRGMTRRRASLRAGSRRSRRPSPRVCARTRSTTCTTVLLHRLRSRRPDGRVHASCRRDPNLISRPGPSLPGSIGRMRRPGWKAF